MKIDAGAFLAEKSAKTEVAMYALAAEWTNAPKRLLEAVEYSLFAGGKRFRPALALGACEMVCGTDTPALPLACALEMIHTYSLIHDDLPAMDNDDLRRGRPTSHKMFGEATAVLAGDTLCTMAFEAAARTGSLRIVQELAHAAGVAGMAGGQQLDMEAENRSITLDELRRIHAMKTGALICASVRCGAMAGCVDENRLGELTRYGEYIGLAFQIADDILDVTGDAAKLGKNTGADAAHTKSTYPALLGIDESLQLANEAADAAVASLEGFGPEADMLRTLARFVVERDW